MEFEESGGFAREMDREDPLAGFRGRFLHPRDASGVELLYLCGNSLGLQPAGARAAVERVIDEWGRMGVEGHFEGPHAWLNAGERVAAVSAKLVGALPGEVAVMNFLTVNLHLMMVSFYRPTPARHRIAMEPSPFPSDLYAAASQARFHGYDPSEAVVTLPLRPGELCLRTEDVEEFFEREGGSVALLLLGGVNYYTGQAFELERICAAARKAGCVVGLDLAHAAGNVPLRLHEWGPDFAAWCSYKYLNGGPGMLAGCFVHERHGGSSVLPRFAGWWGEEPRKRFAMEPEFLPAAGAAGWHVSNQPPLLLALMEASLAQFEEAGMERLREKSVRLTAYLEFLLGRMQPAPFTVVTPRDPAQRGAQLSLRWSERGREVFDRISAAGVVCDWRRPDVIRVAPVPLYNSFSDVHRFAGILRAAVS
jgi:kynureninase